MQAAFAVKCNHVATDLCSLTNPNTLAQHTNILAILSWITKKLHKREGAFLKISQIDHSELTLSLARRPSRSTCRAFSTLLKSLFWAIDHPVLKGETQYRVKSHVQHAFIFKHYSAHVSWKIVDFEGLFNKVSLILGFDPTCTLHHDSTSHDITLE